MIVGPLKGLAESCNNAEHSWPSPLNVGARAVDSPGRRLVKKEKAVNHETRCSDRLRRVGDLESLGTWDSPLEIDPRPSRTRSTLEIENRDRPSPFEIDSRHSTLASAG
jgi:hypothetical protein